MNSKSVSEKSFGKNAFLCNGKQRHKRILSLAAGKCKHFVNAKKSCRFRPQKRAVGGCEDKNLACSLKTAYSFTETLFLTIRESVSHCYSGRHDRLKARARFPTRSRFAPGVAKTVRMIMILPSSHSSRNGGGSVRTTEG